MRVGRKAAGRTRRAFLGPCPPGDGGGPAARFLGTARPFQDGRPLKVCSKEVRARTISRNRDAAAVSMRSIDGRSLDLDDVIAVARQGEPVRLAPAAAKRVDASRRALEKV